MRASSATSSSPPPPRTRRRCSREPPDWRAIERWLRETDRAWREGDLGSVDPGAWKKLDARLKDALAPLRDALGGSARPGEGGAPALIAEAAALAPSAMDREAPSQVKAIQARWQEHAKALPLAQRDERALWERFRAACDAVFEARHAKRKEEDGRKQEGRRALEEICAQLEQLATATDKDEKDVRARAARPAGPLARRHARSRSGAARARRRASAARKAVEAIARGRARAREAAVWQTLAAKERLCEELEAAVARRRRPGSDRGAASERWSALPELPPPGRRRCSRGATRRSPRLPTLPRPAQHRAAHRAGQRRRAAKACSSSRWRWASRAPPSCSRSGSRCR